MRCPQKDAHGICNVIRQLGGIGVKPLPPFCRVCKETDTPKTGKPNNITVTLAYGALRKFDPAAAAAFKKKHARLLAKVVNKGPQGPGTELAKMLHRFGFKECTTCNKHARTMNNNGCDWCEQNEEMILGWLEESAKKRRLPFSKYIASKLLQRAIKRARSKQASQ